MGSPKNHPPNRLHNCRGASMLQDLSQRRLLDLEILLQLDPLSPGFFFIETRPHFSHAVRLFPFKRCQL